VGKLRSIEELFAGRHFDREVIIVCVRWYLRYKLSFRDLVEMMAARGLSLAHTTILSWVRRYAPELSNAQTKPISRSRENGLTCIEPQTRPARLLISGSAETGPSSSEGVLSEGGLARGSAAGTITPDGYSATCRYAMTGRMYFTHRTVCEMKRDGSLPKRTKLRSSKYLNNLIERDHRGIKSRTRLMLGSRASPLRPTPSLEWNCFVESIKVMMGIRLTHHATTGSLPWHGRLPKKPGGVQRCVSSDDACREYLRQLRWPEGFVCPRCDGKRSSPVRSALMRCHDLPVSGIGDWWDYLSGHPYRSSSFVSRHVVGEHTEERRQRVGLAANPGTFLQQNR
jgi:hypothetical protein